MPKTCCIIRRRDRSPNLDWLISLGSIQNGWERICYLTVDAILESVDAVVFPDQQRPKQIRLLIFN
jgi:hypothetical protein